MNDDRMIMSFIYFLMPLFMIVVGIYMGHIIAPIIGGAMFILIAWGFWTEWKEWNYGIGPTGNRWESFDTDSSGAVGYKDGDGHTLWISYFHGRLHRKEENNESDT